MANPEHVATVKLGAESVAAWRNENPGKRLRLTGANLNRADLAGANLGGADLSEVELIEANLTGANFVQATLTRADLTGADLSGADLRETELIETDFRSANLTRANLSGAFLLQAKLNRAGLAGADLTDANLSGAALRMADLSGAFLIRTILGGADLNETEFNGADLSGSDLSEADLTGANLSQANLQRAEIGGTKFGNVNLSAAKSLETINHFGASTIGVDTLVRSQGQIPEIFLRGCGLTPWQILQSKLYDPALTAEQFAQGQNMVYQERISGPLYIGGAFISYSHKDAEFVDRLYERLEEEGMPVWLDQHDIVTGPLHRQMSRAVRQNDVLLLVLSEPSVNSNWIENQLEMAQRKEDEQGREVLCPVALDDSWKTKGGDPKSDDRQLWRSLTKNNILDFSAWKTTAFATQFDKLLRAMKVYYEAKGD